MPRKALVTIGTDGFVDYVQVPDGQRHMLGSVSVLSLIAALTPLRHVRAALDEFLANKQVMLSVDLDKMWSMFPYHRARYSSTNPLIGEGDRTQLFSEKENVMSPQEIFVAQLASLEEQVAAFERQAKIASGATESVSNARVALLQGLVANLRLAALPPEFLKNIEKKKEEAKDDKKDDDKKDEKKEASYEAFKSNTELAEGIVATVSATDEAINRLMSAGKKFNSVRAKADLHKIASQVTDIARDVDMAQDWVTKDLTELSKRASEIHNLFVPAGK